MKKLATIIGLTAVLAFAASAAFAANAVRINQVFGSNGAANAYNADFIELYNSGGTPVTIGGWTIQYGSATTTTGFGTASVYQIPAGASIPACGYYLVQLASTTGGVLPVTPDAISAAVNLSGSNGKIALTTVAPQALPCSGATTTTPSGGSIVDQVAYGTGAGLCWEGTGAAPGLGTFVVLQRKLTGNQDTDQNAADFVATTVAANAPILHNSLSEHNPNCTIPVPTINKTWGSLKSIYR